MRLGSLILAGGRSRRMGQPKELLPFRGNTLLGSVAAAVGRIAAPVLVVARDDDQELPELPAELRRIHDEHPDGGPLWGLRSGLHHLFASGLLAADDAILLLGCDQPFVQPAVVQALRDLLTSDPAAQVAVARANDRRQPLGAIYRLSVRPAVDAAVAAGARSLQELLRQVRIAELPETTLRRLDPDQLHHANCNTPSEWRHWQQP